AMRPRAAPSASAYASPAGAEAKHLSTAAATAPAPATSSTVRYCPAKLASAVSSAVEDERTATRSPSCAHADSSSPGGAALQSTKRAGTGRPSRRSRARPNALAPTRSRSASVNSSSQSTGLTLPGADEEEVGEVHGQEREQEARFPRRARLRTMPRPG